jgi:hypothetical protein
MYLITLADTCISHVSCISDTYLSGYIQEVSISDNESHMYPAYVS